jgi:hypothetical protein
MTVKKFIIILFSCVMVTAFSAAQAADRSSKSKKSSKSQSGGLPALAVEVQELRALIEALQGQLNESADPYTGTYVVSLAEHNAFGCGFTNDPVSLLGSPDFLAYLQAQAISSTTTRIAYFEVESDGLVLSVPDYLVSAQELRLSGSYEERVVVDGNFNVTIAADGSLLADAGDGSIFRGQMSADGSSFVAQAFGLFDENGCDDSFIINLVGVRK